MKANYLKQGGSIHVGMGESNSLWVDRSSSFGAYVLDELHEFIAMLKLYSRTWSEEKAIMTKPLLVNILEKPLCLNPKGVLLDLDGVLYDSMKHYEIAWKKGFNEINMDVPVEEVYIHEGNSAIDTVKELSMKYRNKQPTDSEIQKVISKRDEVLESLEPPSIYDNAKELLNKIKELGLSMCIVTSSSKPYLKERIVKDFEGLITIENIVNGNDVVYKKPNPDPYLMGSKKLGLQPHQVFAIENAPLGTISAISANIMCICINSGPLDDKILEQYGASAVFKSCGDLLSKIEDIVNTLSADIPYQVMHN